VFDSLTRRLAAAAAGIGLIAAILVATTPVYPAVAATPLDPAQIITLGGTAFDLGAGHQVVLDVTDTTPTATTLSCVPTGLTAGEYIVVGFENADHTFLGGESCSGGSVSFTWANFAGSPLSIVAYVGKQTPWNWNPAVNDSVAANTAVVQVGAVAQIVTNPTPTPTPTPTPAPTGSPAPCPGPSCVPVGYPGDNTVNLGAQFTTVGRYQSIVQFSMPTGPATILAGGREVWGQTVVPFSGLTFTVLVAPHLGTLTWGNTPAGGQQLGDGPSGAGETYTSPVVGTDYWKVRVCVSGTGECAVYSPAFITVGPADSGPEVQTVATPTPPSRDLSNRKPLAKPGSAPILVSAAHASKPLPVGAARASKPLPTAAAAGLADTAGQLTASGVVGLAALVFLGAGFATRRRRRRRRCDA
jgi:hypothetical protein